MTPEANRLKRTERDNVPLVPGPARGFGRFGLRQGLIDDRPQSCDATPATWTTAEALIDRAWRPRAHPAGNNILDFCVS